MWVALRIGRRTRVGDRQLDSREKWATAFFGVRGISSIYYLAYATGHEDFSDASTLWSTVAFVITLSVIVHGVSATPVMRWLDSRRGRDRLVHGWASAFVSFDHVRRTHGRIVDVPSSGAKRIALTQQVPALVELNLDVAQALVLLVLADFVCSELGP